MTLGVAWIRHVNDVRELVIASDSRLSGGSPERWDSCPKALTLPRTDAVMSFAGVTELAYPVMLQVMRAIETTPAQLERRYDLSDLSSVVEDIINQMITLVRTDSKDSLRDTLRRTEFLLAGYSWRLETFRIWHYGWRSAEGCYIKSRCRKLPQFGRNQVFKFIGKPSWDGKQRLNELLQSRGVLGGQHGLDMEPLGVLTEIIKSKAHDDVGGAPQVIKVYRHLNSEAFATLWKSAGKTVPMYAGRPLLEFERPFAPPLDPQKPTTHAGAPRRLLRLSRATYAGVRTWHGSVRSSR